MLRIDRLSPLFPVPENIGFGEFERKIREEPEEIVGVFGTDGRLVLAPKRGGSDEISFVRDESPYLWGTIVTHNHPASRVFSYDDAAWVAEQDVVELRAVCPDGVVDTLLRPEEAWPPTDSMLGAIERSIVRTLDESERRRRVGTSTLKG